MWFTASGPSFFVPPSLLMVIMTTSPNYDKVVRERFNAMLHAAGLFILYTAPPSDRSDRFLCCVTNLGVRRTEGLPNGSFSVSTVSLRRSGGSGAPFDGAGPDICVMGAGLTVPGVSLRQAPLLGRSRVSSAS